MYFKNKIEKIKTWEIEDNEFKKGTRKHTTKSELVELKERDERYLILYKIEERNNDEGNFAYITECFIFKYKVEFELIH